MSRSRLFELPFVSLICVAVLAAMAFAVPGQLQATQKSDGPDLSAYALPDGTIPVICHSDEGEHPSKTAGTHHCSDCLPGAGKQALSTAGLHPGWARSSVSQAAPAATAVIGKPLQSNAHPVRGPPVGLSDK